MFCCCKIHFDFSLSSVAIIIYSNSEWERHCSLSHTRSRSFCFRPFFFSEYNLRRVHVRLVCLIAPNVWPYSHTHTHYFTCVLASPPLVTEAAAASQQWCDAISNHFSMIAKMCEPSTTCHLLFNTQIRNTVCSLCNGRSTTAFVFAFNDRLLKQKDGRPTHGYIVRDRLDRR